VTDRVKMTTSQVGLGVEEYDFDLTSTAAGIGQFTSDFTTHFPHPIELPGNWVVAMTSICFSKNINNIPYDSDGEIRICLKYINRGILDEFNESIASGRAPRPGEPQVKEDLIEETELVRNIPVGDLKTTDILIASIFRALENLLVSQDESETMIWKSLSDFVDIEYLESTNKITFTEKNEAVFRILTLDIHFSPQLNTIIGLRPHEYVHLQRRRRAGTGPLGPITGPLASQTMTRNVDMNAGVYIMLVMSDSIGYSYIGDQMRQLLRVVTIADVKKTGGFSDIEFINLHWRPITLSQLSSFNIKLHEDIHGNRIKFAHGGEPVGVHLKLRRIR